MCNLSEGIREEGREEGRAEGRLEGRLEGRAEGIKPMVKMCQEFGISFSETVNRIFYEFNMSISDAENIVKEYWE
jgi:predicted transposase YdaD